MELYPFWLYKGVDAGVWMAHWYMGGLGEQGEDEMWRTAIQVEVHLLSFYTIDGWGTKIQNEILATVMRDLLRGRERRSGSKEMNLLV